MDEFMGRFVMGSWYQGKLRRKSSSAQNPVAATAAARAGRERTEGGFNTAPT